MAWIYIFLAGLFEIAWAIGLKYTEGWTKFWPSVGTGVALVVSFALLSQGIKTLPIGTAYAVWMGIGAVGVAIFGIVFLGESRDAIRLFCIALVVAGIAGLKFSSGQ